MWRRVHDPFTAGHTSDWLVATAFDLISAKQMPNAGETGPSDEKSMVRFQFSPFGYSSPVEGGASSTNHIVMTESSAD